MSKNESGKTVIIDAKGQILGRMASTVAKRLLKGETIVIVNAEEAIISGKRPGLLREAEDFLQIGHFRKGPFHPRKPDAIVKRTVRGMLPRRKPRGKEALKRLRVYSGMPSEFKEKEKEMITEKGAGDLRCPYIKVSELARSIGWKE